MWSDSKRANILYKYATYTLCVYSKNYICYIFSILYCLCIVSNRVFWLTVSNRYICLRLKELLHILYLLLQSWISKYLKKNVILTTERRKRKTNRNNLNKMKRLRCIFSSNEENYFLVIKNIYYFSLMPNFMNNR